MPQINRIRVNNVKYNFGTQFYDDFVMRFSCKNTIYDLANGGGKSVLMLLLLQNLIPNCTLDDKQPIEKLFRTGSGSNTIHSLVEWKLDPENIKNNYRYMLTGFCARRARDDDREENTDSASIEYFNYCIFYRDFNDNDLKNLPLSNGNERITFNGLKTYLRELEKKDLSLEIKIFDRKGEYQRFIAKYGLYESQWEIIRGINKTEGHVRTYFETNYKTTRKVVEDLLIEEIIEKSFNSRVLNDGAQEDNKESMARTLLGIKDKLIELSKRKDDIGSFDLQIEAIESFVNRVSGIRQLYFGKEELHDQIVKCSNTLNGLMKKREDSLNSYKERQQDLLKEKKLIEKQIDTIKVLKNMAQVSILDEEISGIEDALSRDKEEFREKKKKLVMMESENDYLDYVYYRRERDGLKAAIDSINSSAAGEGRAAALNELAALAAEKRGRNEKRSEEINGAIEKEREILEKENEISCENRQKEMELLKKISVSQYLQEDYSKKIQEINHEICKEREKLQILFSANPKAELLACTQELKEAENQLEKINQTETQIDKELEQLEHEYETKEMKLTQTDNELDSLLSDRENLEEKTKKIHRLQEVYGDKNIDQLYITAMEKYSDIKMELSNARAERENLIKYAKNLENGCPVGKTAEVKAVLEYIEKYHGDVAISGSDYMSGLSNDEKEQMISAIPLLPYGIIIRSGFATITADTGIRKLLSSDYAVPLFRAEAVKNGEFVFNTSNVSFVMRDGSLFTDEEAVKNESGKTEDRINNLSEKIGHLSENEKIVAGDLDYIRQYRDVIALQVEENQTVYEERKVQRKQIQAEMDSMENRKQELADAASKLMISRDENQQKQEALRNKIHILQFILEKTDEELNLEQHIRNLKTDYESNIKEYRDVKARIDAGGDSSEYRKAHIAALIRELEEINKRWDNLYKPYYKETFSSESYDFSKLSDEELDAKAKGYADAIHSQVADIKDKQRLMNNYDVAMEKSLEAIDYKGVNLNEIIDAYLKGQVIQHSRDELMSFRRLLDGAEKSIGIREKELAEKRTERDKIDGAVAHGKEAIVEKYGDFSQGTKQYISFDDTIAQNKAAVENIDALLCTNDEKIKEIENTSKEFIIYRRDLDKIIENSGIHIENSDNVLDDGVSFGDRLQNVIEKFDKYNKDIQNRQDEFQYEKTVLSDTLKSLSSYQLAQEIRDSVFMPGSVRETEELMESLREIISCIRLERTRVEKSIEDMEHIKDNFENQCIQSCVSIKTELERLPKLSKINMDGESISIIGLTVPYVKEEMYKQRMSQYIDDIVETADGMKNEDERIKYIKNQLSWKRMFSVIVTDMNGIKLTLYKRERIKEQSRYLRYEEAVGSTGQSQGIYIQFLIAIINYITSINSGNMESRNLGKVIFIDNPFGAAKDVYIWEPIFKMLKTNNVQLIVPCRGATPAITGRFDINYILGQKMIDGKQQTVVVEYYSNVESDGIEYEKLSFEQSRLTFN